jgi:hypothetical protein
MNKGLSDICLAIIASACAFAQSHPPTADDKETAGLLGKDYLAIGAIRQDSRHSTSKMAGEPASI